MFHDQKIKRKSDHQKDGSTSSLFPKKSKKLEEIISSDSEDDGSNNRRPGRHSSEDEEMEETAHERKIRLAKKYLEQIEREEEDRIESNEIDSSVVIRNRLRQDVLESAGRFIKKVSQDYTGIDLGNARHLKNGHRLSITCLVSCSSKNVIFTGGKEGRLIKWCLKTCQKLKIIPEIKKDNKTDVGHSSSILSLAISSDSKFLTSCDESNSIKVWDPETLNLYKNLTGHRAPVTGLSFRKSTHTLYSCSKDRTVKVWNLETETDMAYLETLFGHQESITSIDSLFKERLITSGGTDSTIRIWKIIEESQLVFQATNGTSIDTVKYLDEQHFLSGSDDGLVFNHLSVYLHHSLESHNRSISLWGIQKKKPLFTVPRAHGVGSSTPNWITAIATLVNTDIFASGGVSLNVMMTFIS